MNQLEAYELDDLKLVYRVLHAQLMNHTELVDSKLLHDLQTLLQRAAREQGVAVDDHGAWDAWLGNPVVPCDLRMRNRRPL